MKNENNLLRAAIQHTLLQPCGEPTQASLSKDVNWCHVIWLARLHRVIPLLFRFLKDHEGSLHTPLNVLEQLKDYYEANAHKELLLKRVAILLSQQRKWGNRLLLKGDMLYSTAIYCQSDLKEVDKLEFIIDREISGEVESALKKIGFISSVPGGNVYSNQNGERVKLTLSDKMASNYFKRRYLDFAEMGVNHSCLFGNCAIPSPEIVFLLQVLKASRNGWNSWEYLANLCALISSGGHLDWRALMALAKKIEMERMARFALLFLKKTLDVPLPSGVFAVFINNQCFGETAGHFDRNIMEGKWIQNDSYKLFCSKARLLDTVRLQISFAGSFLLRRVKSVLFPKSEVGNHLESFGEYVPTAYPIVQRMLELTGLEPNDIIFDLGCGDGRFLVCAAVQYGCRGVGVDTNPERIQEAENLAVEKGVREKIRFCRQDVLRTRIAEATVVVSFLNNYGNNRLLQKFQRELKSGSRIVTQQFILGEIPPYDVEIVRLGKRTTKIIYLWRIK